MKPHQHSSIWPRAAFTLIELLVVIAIIAVVAGLILPLSAAVKARAIRSKAQAELQQISLAIETYREHYGQYPPDNPANPLINPLYFELVGTRYNPTERVYETLDGAVRLPDTDAAFQAVFGTRAGKPAVRGFVNCTRGGEAEDAAPARRFLTQLKPAQLREVSLGGQTVVLLTCSVSWPENHPFQPLPGVPGANPWRYVSSQPTNNVGGFDLWVDVWIGGKTNRIANWGRKTQIVP